MEAARVGGPTRATVKQGGQDSRRRAFKKEAATSDPAHEAVQLEAGPCGVSLHGQVAFHPESVPPMAGVPGACPTPQSPRENKGAKSSASSMELALASAIAPRSCAARRR